MRGSTAIGVLALTMCAWLTWITAPLSGAANPGVDFGWLAGGIGAMASVAWLWQSDRLMAICGVAGLGLATFSLLHLAYRDPALWYLTDENTQAANIITFSQQLLPGNYGIQPTFRARLDTETWLGRLATASYFMSWGWMICLAGSLLLLVSGLASPSRRQILIWISLATMLIFGGQAVMLGSSLAAEYFQDRGHRHLALGRFAEATREYERAQRWNPQLARSLQAHLRLGEAYYQLEMFSHPNARLYAGERYAQEENYKSALVEFFLALQEAPMQLQEIVAKRSAWIYVFRGIAQARSGQLGPAIGHWERALAFDSTQVQAAYFLARAYFEQSRYEQSVAMSRFVLSRSQNRLLNANLQFNIGDCYWQLNDFDRARLAYEASMRLDSYGNFRIFKSLGGT
jgi:tetratricopeptide (TPR) repeat protein